MGRAPNVDAGFGVGGPPGQPDEEETESPAGLIYIWDALSLWCFGAIPALRHLSSVMPELPITVLPGGLHRSARGRRYSDEIASLQEAEPRLRELTGRKLHPAHVQMVEARDPLLNSAVPALALLRIQSLAPTATLDIAHQLTEAHFIDGADLNDPASYSDLIGRFALPEIPVNDLPDATDDTPEIAAVYALAKGMQFETFPTFVLGRGGEQVARISGIFDPGRLEAEVRALLS